MKQLGMKAKFYFYVGGKKRHIYKFDIESQSLALLTNTQCPDPDIGSGRKLRPSRRCPKGDDHAVWDAVLCKRSQKIHLFDGQLTLHFCVPMGIVKIESFVKCCC